jgi:hypothetical protein
MFGYLQVVATRLVPIFSTSMDSFFTNQGENSDNFQHSFNQRSMSPTSSLIVSLDINEVMKNPHVKTMYRTYQDACKQALEGARVQANLWQENARLVAENEALKNHNWQSA